jgi:divinyl protochlorophyllide a 8-vinyl-reductase
VDTLALATAHADDGRATRPVVGPNAVIQLAAALRARGGDAAALDVFAYAHAIEVLDEPPGEMVDERIPRRLFGAVIALYRAEEAAAVLQDAGERTADYLLANRIPGPAQAVLKVLPRPLASRALLAAIGKNAWTFAGSGRCTTSHPGRAVIEINDNPLATPHCAWHAGVFGRLFGALVTPHPTIRHPSCCAAGDPVCRFEIA